MEEDNYSQQELFEQRKYISDLIEEKTERKTSSLNVVVGSTLLSSGIVLGFLFLWDDGSPRLSERKNPFKKENNKK